MPMTKGTPQFFVPMHWLQCSSNPREYAHPTTYRLERVKTRLQNWSLHVKVRRERLTPAV